MRLNPLPAAVRAGFLGLLAAAAPARAAGPYLHGFEPFPLLPPPPALHDPEDAADREATFRIYAARTPAEVATGKAEHKVTLAAFAAAIGPGYQRGRYPKLEALFREVEIETKRVVDEAKEKWHRPRPFVADPARFTEPGDPEKTPGYPSGHSTRGTVFALLLAEVFPAQREAILAKGRAIGWVRVEIGVHTPLDIYAGRVLGRGIAQAFLRDPGFQRDLAKVKAEIAGGASDSPPAPARRVVVVVFDGMRPDFVSEENTPNLWKLGRDGVCFAHHHPVYLSATEVNGTAIATGDYPRRSFIIANAEFRPAIDAQQPLPMENVRTIRRGDGVSGGRYLGAPTVAEILHARGWATAIAGSKPIALFHDRAPRAGGPGVSPVLYEGVTEPAELGAAIVGRLGEFPPLQDDQDKIARDRWTTRALTEVLWRDGVPPYSLLWLAEPDISQHTVGPGAPQALAAIRSSDANLGVVLAELDRRGLRDSTDVLVVSDHGFSTIAWKVDVAVELSAAGFRTKRAALGGLHSGDVLAVANGGSTLLYVGGHDPEVCRRLAAYLQVQEWTGVVFSREPEAGTFPLAEARIDSPDAPDLVVSLRWTRGKSATGVPGLQTSDLAPASPKVGNHASLSPYDMHNTLLAAGPDFRRGVTDPLPSGNTDLAPTILWILGGRDEAAKMDGRVLGEALATDAPAAPSLELNRLTARRLTAGGAWEQYLQISEVGGVRYLDEGNGAFNPR